MSTDPQVDPAFQKRDLPQRNRESRRRTGSISVGLAVLFVVGMIIRAFDSGFRDLSMIVTVAVAAAALFYFLAPRLFGAEPPETNRRSWDPSAMTDDTDETRTDKSGGADAS